MAEGLITDRRLEESTAKALTFAPVEIAKKQSPPDARDEIRSARRRERSSSMVGTECASKVAPKPVLL
jgi:hypothetical protein